MDDSRLPRDITTAELMQRDYHYNYAPGELYADWARLQKTAVYKNGSQFKPGMKLCQHFFPNFWRIQNARGQSFASAWQDPELMNSVREWGLSGMSNLWMSWIRRAVYMRAGLPNSSFYRPHFSKQICEMTGLEQGRVFDPCMGWAGRLLGTVAAGWHYTGCDPNTETFANIGRLVDFLEIHGRVDLHCQGAEAFDYAQCPPVDVVVTSPPYFNLEVYTDSETQSYNRHSSYESWRDQWWLPTVRNCLGILKPKGISAWNVMNFGGHDLVQDLITAHESAGWHLTSTLGFDSPLANLRKIKNRDVTYIFRRSDN